MRRVDGGPPVPAAAVLCFFDLGVERAALDDRTDVEHADVNPFVGHLGVE
jgi:hypothetical protein